jgi:uncharacterized protein Yka (UPF0111/DUF47 family)
MRQRGAAAFVLAALVLGGVACADEEDRAEKDICSQFRALEQLQKDVVEAREDIEGIADVVPALDDLAAEIRGIKDAAEGRYGQQFDALLVAVEDLRSVVEIADESEVGDGYAELVRDSVDDVRDAYHQLTEAVGASCEPPD